MIPKKKIVIPEKFPSVAPNVQKVDGNWSGDRDNGGTSHIPKTSVSLIHESSVHPPGVQLKNHPRIAYRFIHLKSAKLSLALGANARGI